MIGKQIIIFWALAISLLAGVGTAGPWYYANKAAEKRPIGDKLPPNLPPGNPGSPPEDDAEVARREAAKKAEVARREAAKKDASTKLKAAEQAILTAQAAVAKADAEVTNEARSFLSAAKPEYPTHDYHAILQTLKGNDRWVPPESATPTGVEDWKGAVTAEKLMEIVAKVQTKDVEPARDAVELAKKAAATAGSDTQTLDAAKEALDTAFESLTTRVKELHNGLRKAAGPPPTPDRVAKAIEKARGEFAKALEFYNQEMKGLQPRIDNLTADANGLQTATKELSDIVTEARPKGVLHPDVPVKKLKEHKEKVADLIKPVKSNSVGEEVEKATGSLKTKVGGIVAELRRAPQPGNQDDLNRVELVVSEIEMKADRAKPKVPFDGVLAAQAEIEAADSLIPDFGKLVVIVIATESAGKHATVLDDQLAAFREDDAKGVKRLGRDSIQVCRPPVGRETHTPTVWKAKDLDKRDEKKFEDTDAINALKGGIWQMIASGDKLGVEPNPPPEKTATNLPPFRTVLVLTSETEPEYKMNRTPPRPGDNVYPAYESHLSVVYVTGGGIAPKPPNILNAWFDPDGKSRLVLASRPDSVSAALREAAP